MLWHNTQNVKPKSQKNVDIKIVKKYRLVSQTKRLVKEKRKECQDINIYN